MTRQIIYADGAYHDGTKRGGWAAVAQVREAQGSLPNADSYTMELKAVIEAVRLSEGQATIITDLKVIETTFGHRIIPKKCAELWHELYEACAGQDIEIVWQKGYETFEQKRAHQLAQEATRTR